jgi:hypothetical protein
MDFRKAAHPKLTSICIVGVVLLVAFLVVELPELQMKQLVDGRPLEYRRLVDEYRRTVTQALGGLGTFMLIWIAWKNLNLIRKGQNTDRFTKAIDQLGATSKEGGPSLEIRLGGIYALDQLAQQDRDEYQTDRGQCINCLSSREFQASSGPGVNQGAQAMHPQPRRLGFAVAH